MLSSESFKNAKSNIQGRAGFPVYVESLKSLGISYYENFLEYGEAHFYSKNGYKSSIGKRYVGIDVAELSNTEQFLKHLYEYDEDKFDYLTFCKHCADAGVYKWIVSIDEMSCTYYDKSGKAIYKEGIPARVYEKRLETIDI